MLSECTDISTGYASLAFTTLVYYRDFSDTFDFLDEREWRDSFEDKMSGLRLRFGLSFKIACYRILLETGSELGSMSNLNDLFATKLLSLRFVREDFF